MSNTPKNTEPMPVTIDNNWLTTVYFSTLSQEKASALDQLHNATNWGLTLVSTAYLLAITKQDFPDTLSLYILLVTLLMGFHFFTRTLKGYINVIRWALLQRVVLEKQLHQNSLSLDNIANLIELYHIKWSLPLRRSDVIIKGLFDLGFGYILSIGLGTIIYACFNMCMIWVDWVGILVALLTIGLELILFFRSPYMKIEIPHDDAREWR